MASTTIGAQLNAEGLALTISALPNGLTVNKRGRPLLPEPFVFQCSPLEQFEIAHQFNMGTWDTIDDDQFLRRGSRQLDTWSFDTLAMYLGVVDHRHRDRPTPTWVPFPKREPNGHQYRRPEWYRDQLVELHNAGAPFRFIAHFPHSTTIRRAFAVLTGFSEVYKHGESDTIYFAGVSFTEWRDPGDATKVKIKLPAHVHFRRGERGTNLLTGERVIIPVSTGGVFVAFDTVTNLHVPMHGAKGSTLADLARHYYGDHSKWRQIATANHLKGGSGSTPIFTHWFPHRFAHGKPNVTLTVPKLTQHEPTPRTPPANAKSRGGK